MSEPAFVKYKALKAGEEKNARTNIHYIMLLKGFWEVQMQVHHPLTRGA